MTLTKAHVLKVFRKKYKAYLANATAEMKNSLWIAETEDLCMLGCISNKQLQSWKPPFAG